MIEFHTSGARPDGLVCSTFLNVTVGSGVLSLCDGAVSLGIIGTLEVDLPVADWWPSLFPTVIVTVGLVLTEPDGGCTPDPNEKALGFWPSVCDFGNDGGFGLEHNGLNEDCTADAGTVELGRHK
ncbi:unnamed protein product [Calypogeia fissa]